MAAILFIMRLTLIAILTGLACSCVGAETPRPTSKPATTQATTTQAAAGAAPKPENSYNAITQKDIDGITYEDAEDTPASSRRWPPTWTISTTIRRSGWTTGQ